MQANDCKQSLLQSSPLPLYIMPNPYSKLLIFANNYKLNFNDKWGNGQYVNMWS